MRVRSVKLCFAEGGRRRPGAVFEYSPRYVIVDGVLTPKPLPRFLEAVDDTTPCTENEIQPPKYPGMAPTAGASPAGGEVVPTNLRAAESSVDIDFLS